MRRGFKASHSVRPPFVPRRRAANEMYAICAQRHSENWYAPLVFCSNAKGGVTRFLEEMHDELLDRLNGNWNLLAVDLTNRSRWGILDFCVHIRNEIVKSSREVLPQRLPERHFAGFDFVALLYWTVCQNCEGPAPAFKCAESTAKYGRAGKVIASVATGGVIDFAAAAYELSELALSAGAETAKISSETRVRKALKYLNDLRFRSVSGPAGVVRSKFRQGEPLDRNEIARALAEELLIAIQRVSATDETCGYIVFFDAFDVLDFELKLLEGSEFSDLLIWIANSLGKKAQFRVFAGKRTSARSLFSILRKLGWTKIMLESITASQLRLALENRVPYIPRDDIERLVSESLATGTKQQVDFQKYSDAWDRYERRPRVAVSKID